MKKFLLNLTIHHWALMMLVAFLSTGITANAQEEKKDNKVIEEEPGGGVFEDIPARRLAPPAGCE